MTTWRTRLINRQPGRADVIRHLIVDGEATSSTSELEAQLAGLGFGPGQWVADGTPFSSADTLGELGLRHGSILHTSAAEVAALDPPSPAEQSLAVVVVAGARGVGVGGVHRRSPGRRPSLR